MAAEKRTSTTGGRLLLVGLFVMLCGRGFAQETKVHTERPRVWLTRQTTSQLRGDAELLKTLSTPEAGLLSNALAYVISGDREIGREAIRKATKLLRMGGGRLHAWGGYAKTFIHPAAICYDWCHDLLSQEEKEEFVRVLNGWAGWCSEQAAGESPYNSLFYGYLWGEAVIGLATFGDNPSAPKWVEHARFELLEKRALPALEQMGGDWVEGNAAYFGPLCLALYFEAQKTACGEDLFARIPFMREAVTYQLHASAAGFRLFYPSGDTPRLPHEPRPLYSEYPEHMLFLLLVRDNLGGTPEAGRAQWLLQKAWRKKSGIYNIRGVIEESAGAYVRDGMPRTIRVPYADALWDRKDQEKGPISPEDLPPAYFNEKSGFVSMRGSWNDDAMVVGFHSGPRLTPWQHLDQNSFTVFGGKDIILGPLMAIAPAYPGGFRGRHESGAKCTFVFDHHGQVEGPASKRAGKILAFHNTEHFAYAVGEAAAAYNDSEASYEPVRTFTRHMLFLRPATLVVVDRVVTKKDVVKRFGLWLRPSSLDLGRDREKRNHAIPLTGPGGAEGGPWLDLNRAGVKESPTWSMAGQALFWVPLLPRQHEVYANIVDVGPGGDAVRLEAWPKERREEDIFVNVFVFEGDRPPGVSCEQDGTTVNVTLKGTRESRIRFVADDPQKGTIAIREGNRALFQGPLVSEK